MEVLQVADLRSQPLLRPSIDTQDGSTGLAGQRGRDLESSHPRFRLAGRLSGRCLGALPQRFADEFALNDNNLRLSRAGRNRPVNKHHVTVKDGGIPHGLTPRAQHGACP